MNHSILRNISTNISTNSSSILNEIISNNTQNATIIIPIIDPYWFYSASAQSAAAIVGLMGAFITTKIINENAFIKQLKKEINEAETKIDYINDEIAPKQKWVNEFDLEEDNRFVDNFLDVMLSHINPLDPQTFDDLCKIAKSDTDYQNLNIKVLYEKYNDSYLDKVRGFNEELTNHIFNLAIANTHGESLNIDYFCESAFKKYGYEYIDKSTFKKKYSEFLDITSSKSMSDLLRDGSVDLLPTFDETPYLNIDSEIEKREENKYRNYKEEINKKEGELSYLNNLLIYKKDQVKSNKDLLNLKKYIKTLVLFSLLGVFIPLLMLLLDSNLMIKLRFVTFVLILSGWFYIIFNLSSEIKNSED